MLVFFIGPGVFRRMLHVMEETRALAIENKHELNHIKLFLMPPSSDDVSDARRSLSKPLDTVELLESFCNRLNDTAFRKSVVSLYYIFDISTITS